MHEELWSHVPGEAAFLGIVGRAAQSSHPQAQGVNYRLMLPPLSLHSKVEYVTQLLFVLAG